MVLERFSWQVTMDSTGGKSFRVKEVNFGDGYSQVAGDGINTAKKEQKIKYVGLKPELLMVVAFLDRHAGYKPFVFKHPVFGEGVYLVDKYSYSPIAKDFYSLTFTLNEAHL